MRLYVPTEDLVDVKIYNIMGQEVGTLYSGIISSGYRDLTWNALDFSSGVYIVRAISSDHIASQKIMLIK